MLIDNYLAKTHAGSRRRFVGAPSPAALYIAALPRSGSTMLANLLTAPPDRWVLVEPGLHGPTPSPSLFLQIQRFLAEPAAVEPVAAAGSPRRLWKLLGDILPNLSFWGLKEVGADHRAVIEFCRPQKTIILVRDIRDALLSLMEKHSAPERQWKLDSQMGYLADCCTALIGLARDPSRSTRICRYEDLVSSQAERAALAGWLGCPLDGQISRNLDLYRREFEIARHQGVISTHSVGRHSREHNMVRADIARRFGTLLGDFDAMFGYRAP